MNEKQNTPISVSPLTGAKSQEASSKTSTGKFTPEAPGASSLFQVLARIDSNMAQALALLIGGVR